MRFAGQPAPDVSARAQWRSKVACVYQKSTIIPELTVGENLFLNDQPGSRFGTIHWREAPAARARGARRLGSRRRRRPARGRADRRPEAAARDRPGASPGQPLHHPRRADRAARAARDQAALRSHQRAEARRRDVPLHLAPPAGDLRDLRAGGGDARRPPRRRGGGRRPRPGPARRGDGRRVLRLEPADRPQRALRGETAQVGCESDSRPIVLDVDSVSVAGSGSRRLAPGPRRRAGRARRPGRFGQIRARRRRSSDS